MAKKPSPSQVQYAKHLLKQVGGDEPDWDTLTDIEASALIDGLKKKRGRPVWYGNGQFSHWEKSSAIRTPPGWVEHKGEAGRPYWTSLDGKFEIVDARGRSGTQRFQVYFLRDGKRQEDIGWPSFSQALKYIKGEISLRDHPMAKLAERVVARYLQAKIAKPLP